MSQSNNDEETEASKWLWDWVEQNINSPLYVENKDDMAEEAAACTISAEAEGISRKELLGAAGGDLRRFLLDRQNSLTDSEVQRKMAEDD